MYMWRRDPEFRAAALESPAPAIAAQLMGSASADFFYDQLFVKEPGTAHPTPWHQDQPYWPVKGWQITSVWIALDPIDRSNGAVEFIAGSHRWGVNYRPTPFRKGHEIKFTDSDLVQIPDIDADRSQVRHQMVEDGARRLPGVPRHDRPRRARATTRQAHAGAGCRCAIPATTRATIRGPAHSSFRYKPDLAAGAPMTCDLFPRVWPKVA